MDPFEQTQRILEGVQIPPQPAVLMEAHGEMQKDEPDLSRVAAILSKDVGLSASVLKTVNSPFFGLSNDVSSIPYAVSLLGLGPTLNIVAGLALKQAFNDSECPDVQGFWDSAANVSKLAAFVSQRLGNVAPDEAYLLGLFHDSGVPLMACKFTGYLSLMQELGDGGAFADEEDGRFRTNHSVVGFLTGRQWGLAQHIRDAILDHHNVERILNPYATSGSPSESLIANLKLAEHADNLFYGHEDGEWERVKEYVLDYLSLSEHDCDDLLEDMQELLLDSD